MRQLILRLILAYTTLLPFERVLSLAESESIFKPYRIAAMLAAACWAGWLFTRKRKYRPDYGDKSFAAIFVYGIAMAFFWNMLEGNKLSHTADTAPLVVLAMSMYVIVKDLRLSEGEIFKILNAHTAAVFGAAGLALARDGFANDRFRGFYKNPNQLGVAAGVCFIYWLSRFLFAQKGSRAVQLLRVACASFSLGLIALSGSRGAAVAALVGSSAIVVFTLVRRRSFGARARIVVFAVMLVGVSYPAVERFDETYQETQSAMRFQRGMAEQSAEERTELWRSGATVGMEHYGLGVGMMQYLSYHEEVTARVNPRWKHEGALGTHSDYVDLFASYGVFGVVVYLAYLLSMARSLVRDAFRGTTLAILGIALLAHNMIVSISQNSFTGGEYFLTLALIDTIVNMKKQPATKTNVPVTAASSKPPGSPAGPAVAAPGQMPSQVAPAVALRPRGEIG